MGVNVVSVHELRLVDSYLLRRDYFMGLSKRLTKFMNENNSEVELHSYALELFHYVHFGYEMNIVPLKTYNKIRDLLDQKYLLKGE